MYKRLILLFSAVLLMAAAWQDGTDLRCRRWVGCQRTCYTVQRCTPTYTCATRCAPVYHTRTCVVVTPAIEVCEVAPCCVCPPPVLCSLPSRCCTSPVICDVTTTYGPSHSSTMPLPPAPTVRIEPVPDQPLRITVSPSLPSGVGQVQPVVEPPARITTTTPPLPSLRLPSSQPVPGVVGARVTPSAGRIISQ